MAKSTYMSAAQTGDTFTCSHGMHCTVCACCLAKRPRFPHLFRTLPLFLLGPLFFFYCCTCSSALVLEFALLFLLGNEITHADLSLVVTVCTLQSTRRTQGQGEG